MASSSAFNRQQPPPNLYNFDPPRLSLEPQSRSAIMMNQQRPASTGRGRPSAFAPTSSMNYLNNNRPISAGAGGYQTTNGSGTQRSSSTTGHQQQHNYGALTTTTSSSALALNNNINHNNPQVMASQERLIQNLKQQVSLLQQEVSQGRSREGSIERHLPPHGTPATHAVIPLQQQNDSNGAYSSSTLNPDQAARLRNAQIAGQFSNDVALLRQRHSDLEKDYGAQAQQLRRQLEDAHNLLLEADLIDPRSLSGPRLVKRNPADARQRVAADERQRQHALEIIELQKLNDRLQSQIQIKDQEISSLNKEKEVCVSDLVAAKDEGRNGLNEIAMQKNQIDQLQKELRMEQEQRHMLEDKVHALQRGGSQHSNASSAMPGSEEQESKIRQLTAQLSITRCEADSAKTAENKWRNEIEAIAQQNAELARAAELSRDDAARLDAFLKDTQAKLEDCEAQREFLQLSVDRMRVEDTSNNARHSQLENILRAERENLKELEKRYNRALEDKDSAMRTLRQREVDQQRRDNEDTKMRAQAKYAIDTSEALKRENEDLRHKNADITRRLETTVDIQTTEQQIQTAIQRMEQAKFDMQNILQKQIKVAQDVSGAISAMPKKGIHQSPASRKAAANLSARTDTLNEQEQQNDSQLQD